MKFKKLKLMKYVLVAGIFTSMSVLTSCASTLDPSDAYHNETQEQIFQKAETALRGHSYKEAIKRFEALDVQYPFGPYTETAQLHIIYAYYQNSDYASAEAAADRFIRIHPTSPNVDYAYFMRALSSYYQNQGFFERMFAVDFATRDLTQVKKSFNTFGRLVEFYPHSRYAPAAHQYMIYLRDVLARHQLEVARFYYDHEAYVAAANRAALVVKHYQGSPLVPAALVIMAKSYHHLHQTELENETLNVIHYNYPNTVISYSYVLETHPKTNIFEQGPYRQNGERNRGRGVTLAELMNYGGTTKHFWSIGPSKQNPKIAAEKHTVKIIRKKSQEPIEVARNRPLEFHQNKFAQATNDQERIPQQSRFKKPFPYHQNGDRR